MDLETLKVGCFEGPMLYTATFAFIYLIIGLFGPRAAIRARCAIPRTNKILLAPPGHEPSSFHRAIGLFFNPGNDSGICGQKYEFY